MKVLILGATGPTGQLLVLQALGKEYQVTAVVRSPARLPVIHPNLTVITANILDQEAMRIAIIGQDAVMSALGPGKDLHSTIVSQAMEKLIPAMQLAGVKRLIFLSSFGSGHTRKQGSLLSRLVFATFLKNVMKDKINADAQLRNSDLNFTLVYPTALTNGKYTGKYRVGENLVPGFFPRISRADVADFMLRQVESKEWIRRTAIVTN